MGGEKPGREKTDDGQASTVAHLGEQTVPAGRDSQPSLDLQEGGTIGRYRMESRLGAGAMGVVWCARDPQLDRRVAIKVLHPNLARSAEASNRLLREARAMAKLSHRAVVTVHDAGEVEGRLFVAMELVDGTTLGQMLRTRTEAQRRDWKQWLDMMLAAGRGLEAAHGAGVLHRDFKPDNVLVDSKGRVCVADFGLATLGEERPQPVSERMSKLGLIDLTTTGALLGTPAYMSPQQLRGEAIDARADQFNFCVATYEALYGSRPFRADGQGLEMIESLETSIERAEVRPPPADSQVPDEVLAVLQHGLAANPEDRWPDMTALLAALERAAKSSKRTMSNRAVHAPSRTLLVVGIGAAVLVVVALIAVLLLREVTKAATVQAAAKRLFEVPLKTRVAVTSDGKRLVLASDRIEVRELDGTHTWTSSLPGSLDVSYLSITHDEVMIGIRGHRSVQRWRYAGDSQLSTVLADTPGVWVGETAAGQLFYEPNQAVVIHDGEKVVRRWPMVLTGELFSISPNRQRIAILEGDRFSGEIVIRDVMNDRELRSSRLENPTALAWENDSTIIYATGTTVLPTIYRMSVVDRFGVPERLYRLDTGWFGEIAVGGGRMFFVEMGPKARARVIDRATQFTRELDAASVGAALAWTSDDEFLTWHPNSQRVERRTIAGKLQLTNIKLPGEPANATLAGDTLIAAVRSNAGRELVAHALGTGERLWSHPAPQVLAARCADDRHPPCFALRRVGAIEQLVTLDPATGALGTNILRSGTIEDLAVNAAGDRIVLASRAGLLEVGIDGTELAHHHPPLILVRSVAYDRDGGFLVAGTLVRNAFQVGRFADGQLSVIAHAENDLLSLVRPSSDTKRVLVHARVYAPMLWELVLP